MAQASEPMASIQPRKPRSRLGLFLPFALLLLSAVLWSAGWFWIRGKAASEMDAWIAREAEAGRTWTCADRSITGFPFRVELRCASLKFARSDGQFTVGPLTAVVQIYAPRHGVVEVAGPFHVEQGDLTGDVDWSSLEGSFHGASGGFVRASLVIDGPKGTVRGPVPGQVDFGAKHIELHARPTPGRFESEGAVDLSLRAEQAAIPQFDALIGNADPADLALDATLERATSLHAGPVVQELETWRQAGGQLDVTALSLVKGPRRIQAQGTIALDEEHRPAGRLELRAAGLEALIGQVMGQRLGAERGALLGNLVGQVLGGLKRREDAGGAPASGAEATGDPSLKPLPSLVLADGRLMLGPFAIPNVRLPVLY